MKSDPPDPNEPAARMLAAAYWRGRLHGLSDGDPLEKDIMERMIAAAAETEIMRWRASAAYLLSQVGRPLTLQQLGKLS